MGLPIHHFVASTNANDIVPNYLKPEFIRQNLLYKPSVMQWMLAIRVILRMKSLFDNDVSEFKRD
jgi:threonine synthase